jgi:YVTN family beta-propeller protein
MNGNRRLAMRRLGRRVVTWKAAWFVLVAWLASAAGVLCPLAGAQTVTGTVGVGRFPVAMQLNPVTNKIYVANSASNNVTVIDGATNTAIATVPAGEQTYVVAVNPVTNKIYIGNLGAANVTVIDGATDTVIATVAADVDPAAIAVNPVTNKIYVVNLVGTVTVIDGVTDTAITTVSLGLESSDQDGVAVNPVTNKIYVANSGTNEVTVIDGATDTAIATVAVGADPQVVAVNPVTNRIYVANVNDNDVTVIEGTTDTAIATVAVGTSPQGVAVNPVTNKIYVANTGSDNVTVIDGATNSTSTIAVVVLPVMVVINPLTNKIYVSAFGGSRTANISASSVTVIDGVTNTARTIGGVLNSSFAPLESNLAVNPVTNKIYVADFRGSFGGTSNVTVIDGGSFPATSVTVGTNPQSIAANPNTNKIYVPNPDSNNLTVIDGATNAITTVAAGTQPVAVAVNPVAGKIYVANSGSNNVTVIDGSANATTTVAAGTQPVAVAVNPVTNRIYIANRGSNNVTVIDGATNATTTVAAGTQPVAVAVNPVTNKIYIANSGSNNVTVIDGTTNSMAAVAAGSQPVGVAVNPVTNKIYIINSGDNSVTVIDGATNTTATVATGTLDSPVAVAVNPITNKIYCVNSFNTVTVLDGATNTTTTVIVGTQPTAVVVNQATNRIYVANSDNTTVIDGATNTVLFPISVSAQGATVNPVTNSIYITNNGDGIVGKVFVVQNQQPLALQAVIAPLPGNITGNLTPTFHLSKTGDFPPLTPPLRGMYMQIDTWQGPWIAAASQGNGQFMATVATPLQPGIHIVYAYADLEDIVFANQQSQAPLMSNITGYAFVVAPPNAGLSPTSLDFGQQAVNTNSPAQTVTLTNSNSPLDISGIAVSGHFLESDNCPAQLAAGASCTISVIFAPVSGDQGNTVTGAVTITDDNHGITGNTDTIALTGVGIAPPTAPPTITKAFGAASIPLNGSTSLTLTISNPNSTTALSGIAFSDSFPAGLIVSASPALNSSCGGTVSAAAGSGTVSLSGGTLAANASCTVLLNVTGTAAGAKNNSVQVTSTEGGPGNTSNATVTVVAPPVIIKTFGATNIPLNGSTSLTFAIQNNNAGTTLTGVMFSDTLPAGLVVSTPNGLTGSCGGGTITGTPASGSVSLTGASIAAGASCTFAVNVTGTTGGVKNNTTGNVISTNGGPGGTASASITVLMPDVTITKTHAGNFMQGQTAGAMYTISVSNIGTAPTVGAVTVTDALPAGLTATAIGGTGWTCPTLVSCNRSDVLANGNGYPAITLTVSVAVNAPASVINSVTVSGGGETNLANDTAADTTAVTPLSGPPLTIVPLNNSTNVSIPAGSSATFGLTVTSASALLGGINFTCSGLPSGAACSFDKQGETQPQTQVTMMITTTANTASRTFSSAAGGTAPLYAVLLLPFFGLVQVSGRGRKSKNVRLSLALLGGFVLLLALAGCGGHAGQHGTPTGTYPISVMATSSTTPSVQALTIVNLTVQ